VTASGDPATDPGTETTLLYVLSEALTNAVKHAGAEVIEIEICGGDGAVSVTVRDDGRGGADASGSGLQGLADRVVAHGGRLRVDSTSERGTTVVAEIAR
jgi:signal transduction histidine kinase